MARSITISSKGRVTLPKELRGRHHLAGGEIALVLDSPEGILIRHGRATLRGLLKGRLDPDSFQKDLAQLREEWTF
jgi:AbrB family looped-hinge helix DNA binding protein